MRIFGALLTVCAAAAVIPYKLDVNKEDKSVNAKGLIYDLSIKSDENGEKSVELKFSNPFKKDRGDFSECCKCGKDDTFEDTEFTEVTDETEESEENEENEETDGSDTENPADRAAEE